MSEKVWGEITTGSIFIADSHESDHFGYLERLWGFLEAQSSEAPVFLMGDVFDLLFGGVEASFAPHAELLRRISSLAQRRPLYWLEGNHDFNLSPFLEGITVIGRESQPALFRLGGERALLAHGDWKIGWGYEIYTKLIRNPWILKILNQMDQKRGGKIFEWVKARVSAKTLRVGPPCKALSHQRLPLYQGKNAKWIFEGHFHSCGWVKEQETSYVALPSLACNESYFVVELNDNVVSIKESTLKES
ncbi:UDP-2,3-diacylglucosamine diphosphatase [Wolinella succinogenes]|uniref:UDP-2,3-diacylglucosamine diphosphatase n=1 Tax=Wolinella succinogenes TaxID=844 RepID=UPI002FCBBB54